MVLPAPTTFSATTGRPSTIDIWSASSRPTISVAPATPTGMISRIGRLGKRSCARAGAASSRGSGSRARRDVTGGMATSGFLAKIGEDRHARQHAGEAAAEGNRLDVLAERDEGHRLPTQQLDLAADR